MSTKRDTELNAVRVECDGDVPFYLFPKGRGWRIDQQLCLDIADANGDAIATFAPGQWRMVAGE